jgi:hypothetical protein
MHGMIAADCVCYGHSNENDDHVEVLLKISGPIEEKHEAQTSSYYG